MEYTIPRSTRLTASRPHTCMMSVALLDHGDTVPTRGVTRMRWPDDNEEGDGGDGDNADADADADADVDVDCGTLRGP